jgi:type I restriction enzyme S subunit
MMDNEQLPKGYKNTEVGVIPEDWVVETLDDISELTSSKRIFESDYVSSGVPFYRGKEISLLNENKKLDEEYFISEEKYNGIKSVFGVPVKNDILITAVGTLGNIYLVPNNEKFYFKDGNLIWIRNIKKVLPEYLSIQLRRLRNEIINNAIGSSQKALTIVVLKKQFFPLPPTKAEQTAIATALSDADALINSLEKLIAKKRNIKQGAMQQLLKPKEGWEVKKLGEISEMFSGGTPLTTNANYYNGGIPWVVIADITKAGKYIAETEKTISNEGLLNSSAKLFRSGVLLFAMYASIGKTTIALMDTTCNQAILGIQPYSINKEYLYYFLSFNERKFATMGQTGTQSNLSKDMVQKIEIPYPIEEEQTYIATILSDMDAEIAALETKLEKYKKVKLGMMQNLLTGKIRLI